MATEAAAPDRAEAASPRAAATLEQVFELAGWSAEPLLYKRLSLHIWEGILEVAALTNGVVLLNNSQTPPASSAKLLGRLLMMPLILASIKLLWALSLAFGQCCLLGSKDLATALRRLGRVHSRSFWILSAGLFVSFSCILMMWYAIVLVTLSSRSIAPHMVAEYVTFLAMVFGAANWAFWRDFVRNCRSPSSSTSQGAEDRHLQWLFTMYRDGDIRVLRHSKLQRQSSNEDGGFAVCAICLDDFRGQDLVTRLPCGHVFHPTCAHRWIREDWRCPFRCPLQAPTSAEADVELGGAAAMAPAPTHRAAGAAVPSGAPVLPLVAQAAAAAEATLAVSRLAAERA
eukprot:TRINITY_DN18244_c0_g1_i1.p1 TRINITY_DN18244_c0_g1~~TRINITY_DN18244_c0_g1_i1.p1  ORF type:complete len:343 (+),score=67.53 TRINITY_DN18244_c0_g1_i1:88-1116(+)